MGAHKAIDYREIIAADGRLIRVFTVSQHPIWMTCIYDERRNIACRMPHLDYKSAYSNFEILCKLLEPNVPDESRLKIQERRFRAWLKKNFVFVFWLIALVYELICLARYLH